ncbi:AAWKG family protein [Streptomyces sp. OM5714]|uniref:AAWKG family protein n=1 Tax=Streptomyces sp. OM5714 TaxID=2602736 RepID=UPI0013DA4C99|nr:AAWKG family protein [Streptomyces sp. OM5714]KAF2775044.1 hypothetical protein STPH1_7231 [Streptomyces sp. OM5714]
MADTAFPGPENDYWQIAVKALTGYKMPDNSVLFEKLIGNADIPLMRVEVHDFTTVHPGQDLESAVGDLGWMVRNSGWRIQDTDFTIPFYSGTDGPLGHAPAGTTVKMKKARITLLGTVDHQVPAGGVVAGSEFSSNLAEDGDKFKKSGTPTVWSTEKLSQYSYGGGLALRELLNTGRTTGFAWNNVVVSNSESVDLGTFLSGADAFDRVANFFQYRAADLRDWEFDLGKEEASWKGQAAGVFRDLIHAVNRNYKAYEEQFPPQKYGEDLRNFRRSVIDATDILSGEWDFWQLYMGNPLRWLHDILVDVANNVWIGNILNVYEDYEANRTTLSGFYGGDPDYGSLEELSTWKKIGEKAVEKWRQSVQDILIPAGKEALISVQNSFNDQRFPESLNSEPISLSQEFSKDQAEKDKADAEKDAKDAKDANAAFIAWQKEQAAKAAAEAEALRKAQEEEQRRRDEEAKRLREEEKEEARKLREEQAAEQRKRDEEAKRLREEEKEEARKLREEQAAEQRKRDEEAKRLREEQERKQAELQQKQEQKQEELQHKQEQKQAEQERKQAELQQKQEQKQEELQHKQEERQEKLQQEQQQRQMLVTQQMRMEREQQNKIQSQRQAEQEAKQEELQRKQEQKQEEQEQKQEKVRQEQEQRQEELQRKQEQKQEEQEQKQEKVRQEQEHRQEELQRKQEQRQEELQRKQEQRQEELQRKQEQKQAEQEQKQEKVRQEQERKQEELRREQEQRRVSTEEEYKARQEEQQRNAEQREAEAKAIQEERRKEAERYQKELQDRFDRPGQGQGTDPRLPGDHHLPDVPGSSSGGPNTTLNPDGSVTIGYPDGSTRTIDVPSGEIVTRHPDGTTESGTLQPGDSIPNGDGSVTTLRPDGRLSTTFPDGSTSVFDPDRGTITTNRPDGTTSTTPIGRGQTLPTGPGGPYDGSLYSPSYHDADYGQELYERSPSSGPGSGYGTGAAGGPGGSPMLPLGQRPGGAPGGSGGEGERLRGSFDDGQPLTRRTGQGGRGGYGSEESVTTASRGNVATSSGGAPFYPPMGGAGAPGGQQQTESGRARMSWVEEDEDVWGTDEGGAPIAIGR